MLRVNFLPYTFKYLNFYNKHSLYTTKEWLFILKRVWPIAMGDEVESETPPALQALTVGRQENTASCSIQTNLVSAVTEAQSAGKGNYLISQI